MARTGGLKSLEAIGASLAGAVGGDEGLLLEAAMAFRVPPSALRFVLDGDILVLTAGDKSAALAYRGLEASLAGWLRERGMRIRRVRWSAG